MKPDKVIDARGMSCPKPILILFKAIKDMKQGDVIHVLADDMAFEVDVKAWCTITNNTLLDFITEDSVTTAAIQVGE